MPLQVRLIHSLGDQVIDITDHTMAQPVVVGRSTEADVQVPSVNVSRRHCLLFQHEGRWVIQDGGSGKGTFVNGQPIETSVFLNPGDVVTLGIGPQAPQLLIDPYGADLALSSGGPVVARALGQKPRPRQQADRLHRPESPSLPQPHRMPGPVAAPYDEPGAEPEAPQELGMLDVGLAAGETNFSIPRSKPARHVPKQKTMSPMMIVVAGVLTLGILGAGGWGLYKRIQAANKSDEVIVIQPPPQPLGEAPVVARPKSSAKGENPGNSIFGDIGLPDTSPPPAKKPAPPDAGWQPPKTEGPVVAGPLTNAAPATEPATQAAPVVRKTDPDFQAIDETHHSAGTEPRIKIARYAIYQEEHPDSPYAADVRTYIDDALDLIWWMKIDADVQLRDEQHKKIADLKRQILEETSPKFKKDLQDQMADVQMKLDDTEKRLKDKNYLSNERPLIYDPDALTELRRARDPANYESWKKIEFIKIRNSRGAQW